MSHVKPPIIPDNIAPGERPLNYKNEGLFDDPYLELLPTIRENPFIQQNWDTFDLPAFSECYEWMRSTWNDLKDILPKLSEDQLRDKWIDPILERLGWEIQVEEQVQRWGKSQRPDYSLFESKETWKKAQGCPNHDAGYMKHVVAIAEAKEMNVPLDGSKLNNTNPGFQIISYLIATGKEWGILTDGRYWRLYTTKSKSSFRAYYEVNVEKFLSERDDQGFLAFFNFFRKQAFLKESQSNQSFLDVVFESGEHYAKEVETQLKDRAFALVELIAQGFNTRIPVQSDAELAMLYENSLYYLFRLLFILNCEAKGLLSVHRQSDYYPYSLRALCLRIRDEFEANQNWANIARSFSDVNVLFNLLSAGDEAIGIHGFGQVAFSSGDLKFCKDHPIPDAYLNKVLLELAFAKNKKDGELRFIDYKRLSADHLGSIFEGLLEFQLVRTGSGKSVSLVNSSGERKRSGSYYTPEHIVDFTVEQTLEPLVNGKNIEEILDLRVLDPAMGSGHFLLGTVRYLEKIILTRLNETGSHRDFQKGVNWEVLHSCVYGIDRNPLAVELAKFSLWIYTAKHGSRLESLTDQFFVANSLIDKVDKPIPESLKRDRIVDFTVTRGLVDSSGLFDAVIGNPPYAPIENEEEYKFFSKKFTNQDYQLDLYLLFLERYQHYLKPEGRLGIIVSNTWLQSIKLRKIREYLCKTYRWDKILNSEDKLFDATVDTHILVFALAEKKKGDVVHVLNLRKGEIRPLHDIPLTKIPQNGDPVNVLADVESATIYNELRKRASTIGSLCTVYNGVKAFEKGKGNPPQTAEIVRTKPFIVEGPKPKGADWKPLLRGSLIRRYKNLWSGNYWIKYGPWLAAPRDKAIFEKELKIMVRQTGDSIIATTVGPNVVAMNNMHIIIPKADLDLYFVLGVLNSGLIDFIYFNMNPEKGEALAEIKKNHVESLPMFDPGKMNKQQKEIAKAISSRVQKLLKNNISDADAMVLCSEIDGFVFEIFGVEASERAVIEKWSSTLKSKRAVVS